MSDVINDVKNVGQTFTNWDQCMSQAYCKWPVIAAIIIASLIVLSVVWCIFSCLCCGMSLCSACLSCLSCGHCCRDCSSSRRRKDPEYHPMPPTPTPYQGYQHSQPMMYNSGPQFATFDSGNKRGNIHEDSLPAHSTWGDATERRIPDNTPSRTADVEMERMLPQQQVPPSPVHDSPYHSDLGAQRLDQQHSPHNDYYDPGPLSPAPTYYSTVPAAAAVPASGRYYQSPLHDRYNHSPYQPTSPYEDTMSYQPTPPYQNTAPYPSSRESRQLAAAPNHNSYQHEMPQHEPYQHNAPQDNSYELAASQHDSYQQPQAARPPSMLQIGRKPVANSYREV